VVRRETKKVTIVGKRKDGSKFKYGERRKAKKPGHCGIWLAKTKSRKRRPVPPGLGVLSNVRLGEKEKFRNSERGHNGVEWERREAKKQRTNTPVQQKRTRLEKREKKTVNAISGSKKGSLQGGGGDDKND